MTDATTITHAVLAQFCQDAYDQPADVQGDHDVARAIVRTVGDVIVVAFPGTRPDHLWDDLADLETLPKVIPSLGLVHTGFWDAMESIAPRLNDLIGEMPVILTGHSLGGAIAIAYAAYRALYHLKTVELVTFGAPRVAIGPHLGRPHHRRFTVTPATLYRTCRLMPLWWANGSILSC